MDTDLYEKLADAGQRRAEAEHALHMAAIEMRDAKLEAQRLANLAIEAKMPKTELGLLLQFKSRQSVYNLLAWKPGSQR